MAATALYMFTPFLYVDLYVRADYPEVLAMLLCPSCAYFAFGIYSAFKDNRPAIKPICIFTLLLAALILTHPFITFYFAIVLVALAVGMWKETEYNWRLPVIFVLCFIAAITLALPYLVTAIQMRDEIDYRGIIFTNLLWLRPLAELLISNPLSNVLVLAGFWCQRKSAIAWSLFAAWLLFFFLQSTASQILWQHVMLLQWTQLPFRALCVEAMIRLIAYAYLFHYMEARLTLKPVLLRLLLAVMVLASTAMAMIVPIAHPPTSTAINFQTIYNKIIPLDDSMFRKYVATHYEDLSHAHDFMPKRVNLEKLEKKKPFSRPFSMDGTCTIANYKRIG